MFNALKRKNKDLRSWVGTCTHSLHAATQYVICNVFFCNLFTKKRDFSGHDVSVLRGFRDVTPIERFVSSDASCEWEVEHVRLALRLEPDTSEALLAVTKWITRNDCCKWWLALKIRRVIDNRARVRSKGLSICTEEASYWPASLWRRLHLVNMSPRPVLAAARKPITTQTQATFIDLHACDVTLREEGPATAKDCVKWAQLLYGPYKQSMHILKITSTVFTER